MVSAFCSKGALAAFLLASPMSAMLAADDALPPQQQEAQANDADKDAGETGDPNRPKLKLTGFADVVYAHNFNRPADGDNWFPGVGTAAQRHGEFSLNQGQIELSMDSAPVGFRLAVGFGTAVEVVHAGEPEGSFVGPDTSENLVYASATYKQPLGGKGRSMLFEMGIFPCHVGYEAFNTKDNWNYTRSWLGELSPYYSAGVRASYAFNERWSAQLHILNGWQIVSDNNAGKTPGHPGRLHAREGLGVLQHPRRPRAGGQR